VALGGFEKINKNISRKMSTKPNCADLGGE